MVGSTNLPPHTHTPSGQHDTRLWKQYLTATSLAGGNDFQKKKCLRIPTAGREGCVTNFQFILTHTIYSSYFFPVEILSAHKAANDFVVWRRIITWASSSLLSVRKEKRITVVSYQNKLLLTFWLLMPWTPYNILSLKNEETLSFRVDLWFIIHYNHGQ